MSKSQSSLSAEQLALLKQFKQQVSNPTTTETAAAAKTQKLPKQTSAVTEAPDDQQLFAQAVQGVRKLPNAQTATINRPKATSKNDPQTIAKRLAAEGQDHRQHTALSDMQALLNPVASEAYLSYRITTLQNRVFDDLKAGKLRWYEAVDLHGCTIEQAREALLQLLNLAKSANENVVKIVHGKGEGGVLKTCVNGWLRQHPDVLAFVSAPEAQGGTGSVLVLLKRGEKK